MITPQEAESRVFTKASFGGGYNMAQVDAFLDILIADYTALYKENATLKSKMKVMVGKIEEFRETEDAMRKTLHGAQQMAETMLREAENAKEVALAEAQKEAHAQIREIQQEVQNEEARLHAAQDSTARYVENLKTLYSHELEFLGQLSELAVEPAPPLHTAAPPREIEEPARAFTSAEEVAVQPSLTVLSKTETPPISVEAERDIDKTPRLSTPVVDEVVKLSAENEEAREDADSDTVVFESLQFGKDYYFE